MHRHLLAPRQMVAIDYNAQAQVLIRNSFPGCAVSLTWKLKATAT